MIDRAKETKWYIKCQQNARQSIYEQLSRFEIVTGIITNQTNVPTNKIHWAHQYNTGNIINWTNYSQILERVQENAA